jgi:hypothetical protein
MSILLELPPDVEAQLITQAAARGMPVEDFLKAAVNALLEASDSASLTALSSQERAEKFVQWARSHSIKTLPLSDEAISRESIYRDREDSWR